MFSCGMIYIPSFIKIGSGIQKSLGGGHIYRHTETHRQKGDIISLLLFLQGKESRLKRVGNFQRMWNGEVA
jgi:hypothetical protein